MYFKGELAAIHLSGAVFYSGGHFQWSSIFKCNVFFLKQALAVFPFLKVVSFFSILFAAIHSINYPHSIIKVAT